MESHENNDGIEFTQHEVEAKPGPNGTILYEVPTSPLPRSQRRVWARAMPNDPARVIDLTMIMDREMVTKLGSFLARHGAIDREPTDAEMSVVMCSMGDAMASVQVDLMAMASEILVKRLGNGDAQSTAETVAESMAAREASRKAKAEGLTKEEAEERAEELKRSLLEWAKRMNGEASDEGGAA